MDTQQDSAWIRWNLVGIYHFQCAERVDFLESILCRGVQKGAFSSREFLDWEVTDTWWEVKGCDKDRIVLE